MVVVKKINTVSCSREHDNLLVGISETQLNNIEFGELTAREISSIGYPDTALLVLAPSSDEEANPSSVRGFVELVALKLNTRHVFYIPLFQNQINCLRSGKNIRIDLDIEAHQNMEKIYVFYGRTEAENEMRLECHDLSNILDRNCEVYSSAQPVPKTRVG